MFMLLLLLLVAVAVGLLYHGKALWAWVVPGLMLFVVWAVRREWGTGWDWGFFSMAAVFAGVVCLLGLPFLRRGLISRRVMNVLGKVLPKISETERIALEAGTVWWDSEFFSGCPDWRRILDFKVEELSSREREFLDGPVEELCGMLDDWQVKQDADLPPAVWDFLKEKKFFGMIIPEEHGGLGFSALAHSAVVVKVSSRSAAAAVTVMVPNSLGPAELLLHYGTDEQRDYYLPRLASGEEIPCFALTEPNAGSDAASLRSEGVICRGTWEGQEVLGMRLNWDKRYITLGPVATLLGLAFKLHDPDRLLGDREDLGITCALVPRDLPGIEIGERHNPLGVAFMNGPTRGKDVFVPLEFVIGGRERVGQGWLMLMQCLAAGRSISLPSLSTGAAQLTSRVISAYASVREQFNVKIGAFEGIEERVARIAGLTYLMNAARETTARAVDSGEKPAVVSAIVKAYMTEQMRVVVNDGMDVQAGAAICEGPRNTLAGSYAAVPIGITVEGANILTRTLIIYGQGALRCHPFVREQISAVEKDDLAAFDWAFFQHLGFTARNSARAFLLALTAGTISSPPVTGSVERHFRALNRYSAAFATLSDVSLAVLGGSLKRREKLSGRLADALAWMYLCACTVKRFVDRDQPVGELPLVNWAAEHSLYQVEHALLGVLDNFPSRPVALAMRALLFPVGAWRRPPSDALGADAARTLLHRSDVRQRLTADIFVPPKGEVGLGQLEDALLKMLATAPVRDKLRGAVKDGHLERLRGSALVARAREKGVIDETEERTLQEAEAAAQDAIQVDAFDSLSAAASAATTPEHVAD